MLTLRDYIIALTFDLLIHQLKEKIDLLEKITNYLLAFVLVSHMKNCYGKIKVLIKKEH